MGQGKGGDTVNGGDSKGYRAGRSTRQVLRDTVHLLALTTWSGKKFPGAQEDRPFQGG